MLMEIKEHVALKPYTTFTMGGEAAYFAELGSVGDIEEFARFSQKKNMPLFVLGGGSNVIFPDTAVPLCIGKIGIRGFEVFSQDEESATLKVGAGEEWDEVVERAVEWGLSGIEALSAIPGTAGATPVQNVGAYGQEIADTLVEVEALDLASGERTVIAAADCGFGYRDSNFKHTWKGKCVILSITLRLSKLAPCMPRYPGVEAYFEKRNIKNPSLTQIRKAIIEVRKKKLPDPKEVASCGSFFKNPIVAEAKANELKKEYPGLVSFPMPDGRVKLAAGWMLDHLGFKGRQWGQIGVYPHNALVLVNTGNASKKELLAAVGDIVSNANKAYGVTLEVEPVLIA